MIKQISRFILVMIITAGITYVLHYFSIKKFFPEVSLNLLNFAYKFNVGFTLLFTTTIIALSKKLKEQMGFIFLASTFIKLALFLFLARYNDLDLEKSVFLHFFIPYTICAALEIFYVIKILNGTNFSKDS